MNEGHAADVIVIGAGIIGAACAQALARRGLRVLVLDAGWHGATAAGMGHLLVLDDNPAELALSQYSLRRWRELAPALPEVVGDAGLLLDPDDVDGWSSAMLDLLADGDERARLAAAGRRRARDFSWATTAAQTLQVYRDALPGVTS